MVFRYTGVKPSIFTACLDSGTSLSEPGPIKRVDVAANDLSGEAEETPIRAPPLEVG